VKGSVFGGCPYYVGCGAILAKITPTSGYFSINLAIYFDKFPY